MKLRPTFPLQRLDNRQMPPRRSRRNAGQKPEPLEVEAGGKKKEEVAVQEEKTDQMPAEAVTKMVMEKKDDSLPVQAEAEAFETAEKYNVIQTEVETEKVGKGKCVPADMRRKNKMLLAKNDNEVDDVCTTDAVAVAESRGDSKPEGRVDDSKSTLTEDATQVVKDDPKAGASGNTAEDDAEVHLETTGSHYGTASYPSPPVCNHINQTEVKRDVSSHRRLNASSSEDEYFSGQEEVNQ